MVVLPTAVTITGAIVSLSASLVTIVQWISTKPSAAKTKRGYAALFFAVMTLGWFYYLCWYFFAVVWPAPRRIVS